MQANTPDRNVDCGHDIESIGQSEIDEVVNSFIESTTALANELECNESVLNDFIDSAEGLASLVQQTAHKANHVDQRATDNSDDLEELESRLSEQENHSARERADTRSRVSELEETVEEQQSGGSDPTPNEVDNQSSTSLETIVALDQQTAEGELTQNMQRSRFVAKDILSYSKKCQAGRTISSSDIATILKSGTDCKGRTATVARVMDFLDEFGEDKVKVVKRRGTKRVIFDEDLAQALDGADNAVCYEQNSVGVI